jgi:hypothetical protein
MTETLLQIWLWGKIIGMGFAVCFVILAIFVVMWTCRKTYYPIKLGEKDLWYSYKWSNGGNIAWIYKKRKLFGYKQLSYSIPLSGIFGKSEYIRIKYNKGEIPWK